MREDGWSFSKLIWKILSCPCWSSYVHDLYLNMNLSKWWHSSGGNICLWSDVKECEILKGWAVCFRLHAVPCNTIVALGELSGEEDIFTLLANNLASAGEMFIDLAGYSRQRIALKETWKESGCQVEERDYWKHQGSVTHLSTYWNARFLGNRGNC